MTLKCGLITKLCSQICLLHSGHSQLREVCRAHHAPVHILETSIGRPAHAHPSELEGPIGQSDRLVSSGADMKVKVWGLMLEDDQNIFSLICLKMVSSESAMERAINLLNNVALLVYCYEIMGQPYSPLVGPLSALTSCFLVVVTPSRFLCTPFLD